MVTFQKLDGTTLHYLTSRYDVDALTVVRLYDRWQTERFFAWIKLHLQLVEDLLADGDKVRSPALPVEGRIITDNLNQGDLMGIPPTGKPINVTAISIDRFEGDKGNMDVVDEVVDAFTAR